MDTLLEEKTAVVTGGASGIGRAISLAYADQGCNVVVADLHPEPREGGIRTHDKIEAETEASAVFVKCDVTENDLLSSAVQTADDLGGVDIMVNNAGIFRSDDFLDESDTTLEEMVEINVIGVYHGCRVAIENMLERDTKGVVINVSSIAGLRGVGNFVSYCTCKGAVRLMSYALADRFGQTGIRVNTLHPGLIETAMTREDVPVFGSEREEEYLEDVPLQRFGRTEEIADAAVFLGSDMSEYVTGESIVVDGGVSNTR